MNTRTPTLASVTWTLVYMTLGSKSGGKPSRKHTSSQSHGQLSSRITKAYISSGKGAISGSSSSHHIHHTFSRMNGTRLSSIKETLTSTKIQARNTKDYKEYQERLDAMTTTERCNIDTLHSGGIQADNDDGQPAVDIMDILSGQNSMDISHVGGEFADLLALGDDLLGPSWYIFISFLLQNLKLIVIPSRPRVCDYRTRRNRMQRRTEAFSQQLPSLVRTYIDWMLAMGGTGLAGEYMLPPDADIQSKSQITVIDILST
jgi:hypothetical protein